MLWFGFAVDYNWPDSTLAAAPSSPSIIGRRMNNNYWCRLRDTFTTAHAPLEGRYCGHNPSACTLRLVTIYALVFGDLYYLTCRRRCNRSISILTSRLINYLRLVKWKKKKNQIKNHFFYVFFLLLLYLRILLCFSCHSLPLPSPCTIPVIQFGTTWFFVWY